MLIKQAVALLEDEPDGLANYANASSLLSQFLSEVNWVGFYFFKNGELVLGPFRDYQRAHAFLLAKEYVEQLF